ncbi:Virulence transcriptional regulatory protein PhoP [compost metagenome]
MVLDLNRKQATLDEHALALTAYEYRILEYLMRHHQQVVAKDRLMEQLYPGDEERDPNVIEVLVGRLRRKLEGERGFKPIDTVRGLGYLFTERCR